MGKVFKRTEYCTCSQKAQRQGKVLVGIFCNLKFPKEGAYSIISSAKGGLDRNIDTQESPFSYRRTAVVSTLLEP